MPLPGRRVPLSDGRSHRRLQMKPVVRCQIRDLLIFVEDVNRQIVQHEGSVCPEICSPEELLEGKAKGPRSGETTN
jgi:hypothetical protein